MISKKRLVRLCKLGKPPISSADIKGIIRDMVAENPLELENLIEAITSSSKGFNQNELEEAMSNYNAKQDNTSFSSFFQIIAPHVDEAINKRRNRAEEIILNKGYQVQPIDNSTYKIMDKEDNDVYAVNLTEETCSCLDYQRISKLDLWCKHLYAAHGISKNMLDVS